MNTKSKTMDDRTLQLLKDVRRLVDWIGDREIRHVIDVHLTAIYCRVTGSDNAEKYAEEAHDEYVRIIEGD